MSFAETTKNGVTVTYSQGIAGAGGAVHAFSTRLGGVSTGIYASLNLGSTRGDDPDCVRENYRRFFQAAGADLTQVAMSNQVHGDVVRPVTSADRKRDLYDPEGYEADGLVTDLPGVSRAAIGPGIAKCCFETHEDVPNAMTKALGVCATPYIEPIEGGKFKVDLKGLNAMRLKRAGLLEEHIDISPDCTACHPEKYWSHRATQGRRGSQAAVIQLL